MEPITSSKVDKILSHASIPLPTALAQMVKKTDQQGIQIFPKIQGSKGGSLEDFFKMKTEGSFNFDRKKMEAIISSICLLTRGEDQKPSIKKFSDLSDLSDLSELSDLSDIFKKIDNAIKEKQFLRIDTESGGYQAPKGMGFKVGDFISGEEGEEPIQITSIMTQEEEEEFLEEWDTQMAEFESAKERMPKKEETEKKKETVKTSSAPTVTKGDFLEIDPKESQNVKKENILSDSKRSRDAASMRVSSKKAQQKKEIREKEIEKEELNKKLNEKRESKDRIQTSVLASDELTYSHNLAKTHSINYILRESFS